MLYFNTSQLHQSRKWYFFKKTDGLPVVSKCAGISNQSQCVGLQASQLRGRGAARKFLPLCLNCPLATTASLSIVLQLCFYCASAFVLISLLLHREPGQAGVPHQCRLLLMHSLQFTRFTYFSSSTHCNKTF